MASNIIQSLYPNTSNQQDYEDLRDLHRPFAPKILPAPSVNQGFKATQDYEENYSNRTANTVISSPDEIYAKSATNAIDESGYLNSLSKEISSISQMSGYQDITQQSMDFEHAENVVSSDKSMRLDLSFDGEANDEEKKVRSKRDKKKTALSADLVSLCRPTLMYPRVEENEEKRADNERKQSKWFI